MADEFSRMDTLAKALIESAAFLELSSDDVLNPDEAVRALESIGRTLRSASPAELAAIRAALSELIALERAGSGRPDRLQFYEQFPDGFGLDDYHVA